MTITPTLAEFLTQPYPDESDETEEAEPLLPWQCVPTIAESGGPLDSIADSLLRVAGSLTHLTTMATHHNLEEKAESETQQLYADLQQAHADLEAKHEALTGLVDDVLAICKPSTSKLANNVREAIASWRAPEAAAEPEPESTEVLVHAAPADDASVEEWRGYARSLGYTGADVDQANRSQIRTMLGIPQPVEGGQER